MKRRVRTQEDGGEEGESERASEMCDWREREESAGGEIPVNSL